jgi:hypothetical protein
MNWLNARKVMLSLTAQGWRSPDTYGQYFEPAGEFPAVYLFSIFDPEDFDRTLIAYVGMSRALERRWAKHNILPEINASRYWPKRWFKRVDTRALRSVERDLIQQFDPPWNIVGRRRGMVIQ